MFTYKSTYTKYLDNDLIYKSKFDNLIHEALLSDTLYYLICVFSGVVLFICTVLSVLYMIGYTAVTVNGTSMEPTLTNNKIIFGKRVNINELKQGNIIIFKAKGVDPRDTDDTYYIKRIVGMPGDKVSFNGKYVYVNNHKFTVKTAYNNGTGSMNNTLPLINGDKTLTKWNLSTLSTRKWNNSGNIYYWNMKSINTSVVPKGSYFVMGDNRSVSNDSREFGYVPANSVMYKVDNENLF